MLMSRDIPDHVDQFSPQPSPVYSNNYSNTDDTQAFFGKMQKPEKNGILQVVHVPGIIPRS